MNALTITSDMNHARSSVLFLIPEYPGRQPGNQFEESIRQMASELARENYVYIAHSVLRDWKDDPNGVRYLCLPPDHIPCFGRLATAYIAEDDALAVAVATEHPEANVFVMRPVGDKGEASLERKAAAWSSEPAPGADFMHLPTILAGLKTASRP